MAVRERESAVLPWTARLTFYCLLLRVRCWLSQVLRLAEAHIKHEKEELKSLNVVLDRNKQDSDQRFMALEARMRATEKDKQEFDLRIYREREQIRALEAALNDIRARSGRTQEMVQKAYSDEQVFLDHVRKLKSSFTGDRGRLEQEVQRVRAQLMQERQMREEAVHRESATLARYRATENPVLSLSHCPFFYFFIRRARAIFCCAQI